MSMSILYVLPKKDYFSHGKRGRVSHAIGVATGLSSNNIHVSVMSGLSTLNYFSSTEKIDVVTVKGFRFIPWSIYLIKAIYTFLIKSKTTNTIIVRYAKSKGILFYFMMHYFHNHNWGFEINSLGFHQLYDKPQKMRSLIMKIESLLLKRADFLYVVSHQIKEDLLNWMPKGYDHRRIIVCPNAGPATLEDKIQTSIHADKIIFAYLGVFQQYYDFKLMIEAFQEVSLTNLRPPISLHLYGDGPQYEMVRIKSVRNKNIILHGRYNLEDLLKDGQINKSTILVLPYSPMGLTEIGSPIKLFEYLALGLPIIAARVGQIGLILKNEETAYLYKPGKKKALVKAMQWMLDNPQQRILMAKKASREYCRNHTWPIRMHYLNQRILQILKEDDAYYRKRA
jgi:glycosyltransferase involved in cell wall biosynthesis